MPFGDYCNTPFLLGCVLPVLPLLMHAPLSSGQPRASHGGSCGHTQSGLRLPFCSSAIEKQVPQSPHMQHYVNCYKLIIFSGSTEQCRPTDRLLFTNAEFAQWVCRPASLPYDRNSIPCPSLAESVSHFVRVVTQSPRPTSPDTGGLSLIYAPAAACVSVCAIFSFLFFLLITYIYSYLL